jgi:taurine dioxygenase
MARGGKRFIRKASIGLSAVHDFTPAFSDFMTKEELEKKQAELLATGRIKRGNIPSFLFVHVTVGEDPFSCMDCCQIWQGVCTVSDYYPNPRQAERVAIVGDQPY